jgi:hypothetical protein
MGGMVKTFQEWLLYAYQVAGTLTTEKAVVDLAVVIADDTGEDWGEVRKEIVGIVRDVHSLDRAVAAGM